MRREREGEEERRDSQDMRREREGEERRRCSQDMRREREGRRGRDIEREIEREGEREREQLAGEGTGRTERGGDYQMKPNSAGLQSTEWPNSFTQ